jgi:predicted dehydrogenase
MEPFKPNRRGFLYSVGATALLAGIPARAELRKYTAAIIGRTGGGDYGHGYDTIWEGLDNVSVEAIADSDAKGLEAAAARSKAKRKYADFREMLQKEKPNLVSIAPRHPDCHKEMALAAIGVGAHIILEKPFTEHLDDADEIVRAAKTKGIQMVVGHKNRYSNEYARMKRALDEGFLGQVLEMRVQGKQDQRAGGEDMIVLGTHDFDTMRFFFGDPVSCSASVTVQGRPITKADVRKGREPMLVAGDTIHASFQFPKNVHCSWQSIRSSDANWNVPPRGAERWGFHIFGTKRVLAYYSGSQPLFWDSPFLGHSRLTSEWKALPDFGAESRPPHHAHLGRDLIHAVETGSKPLCDAEDGRWTIEMAAAVYESQRLGSPVKFPLKERSNPLLRL